MIKANELKIGNQIDKGIIVNFYETGVHVGLGKCFPFSDINPIPITDEWLLMLGFVKIKEPRYVNGYQYLLQVTGHHDNIETEGIDRSGTWFDGIGGYRWEKDGSIGVNVLCKGNYVCKGANYVHELQNLFFALSGKELEIRS